MTSPKTLQILEILFGDTVSLQEFGRVQDAAEAVEDLILRIESDQDPDARFLLPKGYKSLPGTRVSAQEFDEKISKLFHMNYTDRQISEALARENIFRSPSTVKEHRTHMGLLRGQGPGWSRKDVDVALVVRLKDSGLSWTKVKAEVLKQTGIEISASALQDRYYGCKGEEVPVQESAENTASPAEPEGPAPTEASKPSEEIEPQAQEQGPIISVPLPSVVIHEELPDTSKPQTDEDLKTRALKLVDSGMNCTEAAAEVGVEMTLVRSWVGNRKAKETFAKRRASREDLPRAPEAKPALIQYADPKPAALEQIVLQDDEIDDLIWTFMEKGGKSFMQARLALKARGVDMSVGDIADRYDAMKAEKEGEDE